MIGQYLAVLFFRLSRSHEVDFEAEKNSYSKKIAANLRNVRQTIPDISLFLSSLFMLSSLAQNPSNKQSVNRSLFIQEFPYIKPQNLNFWPIYFLWPSNIFQNGHKSFIMTLKWDVKASKGLNWKFETAGANQ